MMNCLGIFLRWVDPGFDDFENEEVVLGHEARIGYAAFEIGEAIRHERWRDAAGRHRREAKGLELVEIAAG